MSCPLNHLEVTKRVVKRAQYEAFTFAVAPHGIRVRNESHADPADHEYLVSVDDGLPTACECPADEHYEGACKHRVAVAIREPVLQAAVARPDQTAEPARERDAPRREGNAGSATQRVRGD